MKPRIKGVKICSSKNYKPSKRIGRGSFIRNMKDGVLTILCTIWVFLVLYVFNYIFI